MALRLAGEDIGIQEKGELISYQPGLPDSGDLEAATKTITAAVEATGTGNADYSSAMTIVAPSDARLAVTRIAARLSATIDSMTAGTLYCRVYVDAQAANNRLFDLSWTTTGAKLAAQDTLVGTQETIFNLLKNGAAHTFYFFFWVNAGNAVLSVVRLWEGVGTSATSLASVLTLTFSGFFHVIIRTYIAGTGTHTERIINATSDGSLWYLSISGTGVGDGTALILGKNVAFIGMGTVATDLNCFLAVELVLRSVL